VRHRRVAATRPVPCHKGASWQRHSDSVSPMSQPRRRLASRTPVPTAPSLVSEVDHIAVRARHRRCPAASAVANSSTVSGALSPPPSCHFSPWIVELSFLSLSDLTQDPPATGASPPRWRTPPSSQFFCPSRRREAPVSYRLHPHAPWVAPPPWVLKRLPLLHLHHSSAATGRDARPESGDRSGVRSRAAPRSRGPRMPRLAWQAVGHVPCAMG
jgi:hypothetical protein